MDTLPLPPLRRRKASSGDKATSAPATAAAAPRTAARDRKSSDAHTTRQHASTHPPCDAATAASRYPDRRHSVRVCYVDGALCGGGAARRLAAALEAAAARAACACVVDAAADLLSAQEAVCGGGSGGGAAYDFVFISERTRLLGLFDAHAQQQCSGGGGADGSSGGGGGGSAAAEPDAVSKSDGTDLAWYLLRCGLPASTVLVLLVDDDPDDIGEARMAHIRDSGFKCVARRPGSAAAAAADGYGACGSSVGGGGSGCYSAAAAPVPLSLSGIECIVQIIQDYRPRQRRNGENTVYIAPQLLRPPPLPPAPCRADSALASAAAAAANFGVMQLTSGLMTMMGAGAARKPQLIRPKPPAELQPAHAEVYVAGTVTGPEEQAEVKAEAQVEVLLAGAPPTSTSGVAVSV
ncbi:hypothetical protein JKP88DRAFT_301237 [Tribonema minus]|uniref:Uncharacterized protein n=1 Tax=Tribonema minus TaxID=303371 RepID=A0A835Z9N0_9STRA|nr:hypothetical protein JKP88DRAFT_301237 [Tribonema minus]